MKKSASLLLFFLFSNVANADVFPSNFSAIVQSIYWDVTHDSMSLEFKPEISTRNQLCNLLVDRYNNRRNTGAGQTLTNRSFSGVSVSVGSCVNALTYTRGYTSSAGLANWAGSHEGNWFDVTTKFDDAATWHSPRKEPTGNPSGDLDRFGNPRIYDFQPVTFTERSGNARYGWNQSHPEVQYIWGWDPKDNNNQGGQVGTHVGFPFTSGFASCIVWLTPQEAFLECISPSGSQRKRTSTGFFGFGQWTVR